jgi:hypothetical protein
MAQVLENAGEEWREGVYSYIRNLPYGWKGIGEDIRLACPEPPHHHNAWGAVISTAVRKGWLQPTGRYLKMRSTTSHARESKEYIRTMEQSG